MENKNITYKISQGVYVLTTPNGGCIVDAVSQVSGGKNPLISVAVMNKNLTRDLIMGNRKFALSVLGKNVDGKIIETFGLNSMRDIDKFELVETKIIDDVRIIKDSLGFMICELQDAIVNDTHTLFIGKLILADVFSDDEVLTYQYYQNHKDSYIKVESKKGKTAWICLVCGYVYYGEQLPDDFKCPVCGAPRELFQKKRINI